jgi:peptidoglycan/xylan/chitin deacetylase (PgdA/CDA1 family)
MSSHCTANRQPIPILMYHQIDAAPPKGAPFRSLVVSPQSFARQMALLQLLGYQGLSMQALQPYLAGTLTGKVVGITFDDGYLNNLYYALPVLQRRGFSSTCYVVSQRLGQTNAWDAEIGIAQTPLMDMAQLRTWVAGGQDVGAHTRHHVRLPRQDSATSRAEIMLCKSELEDGLGVTVNHFCYPYGEYTSEHTDMVREAGFCTATTTQRSRCLLGEDMLQLPRAPVARSTSLLNLWMKLGTAYEDRRRA